MKAAMSEEVRIGKRFSIVIPKRVRKLLELREGQAAMVSAEDGRILVEPLPDDPYGVLEDVLGDFSYSEERYEKTAEEWLRRVARSRHRSAVRS
jgi:AbrB family looped-hinge helix DNA binding protein